MLSKRLITGPLLIIVAVGLLWLDEWVTSCASGGGQLPRGFVLLSLCLLVSTFAAAGLSLLIPPPGRPPPRGPVRA